MSNFAALMALSQTQTRQSEAAIQSQLAEKRRKDAEKQKAQDAKERREREIELALRKKHLEEQERAKERAKREAEERARKERELERKEAEQRDALRYGPKKYPSARRAGGGGAGAGDSDGEDGGGFALTREERRKRKFEMEMSFGSGKRGSSTIGRKPKRLPGFAYDAGKNKNQLSVKDKIAAESAGLIKLNTNKKDTRSIDEIVEDIAKNKEKKILAGDRAKEFADWFGKGKSKAKSEPFSQSQSQSQAQSSSQSRAPSRASSIFGGSPSRLSSVESLDLDFLSDTKPATSRLSSQKTRSASSTPPVQARPKTAPSGSSSTSRDKVPARGSSIFVKAVGGRPATVVSASKSASSSARPNGNYATNGKSTPASTSKLKPNRPSTAPPRPGSSASLPRKRPRSPSSSISPPPAKRRPVGNQGASSSISTAIWAMFGKDRNTYVSRDIDSDEDDMEADARDLEREEMASARIARREDELALEEERRHEEEKRRKRKEKDRRLHLHTRTFQTDDMPCDMFLGLEDEDSYAM
ncbi:hypothetical protein EIP91_004382 [Steccherinum ochraceum]|uniref:Uncharacterized protein n=1 Tax=Steccherinum ochraceum TaxID=92696 RepID=A0A4R0RSL0_9APHY|nr:hypothetical protein EIP91_004382 [Steccherinum ochraceum]